MKNQSHSAAIPFSISPDAEDYLRTRIKEMPPESHPALVMTNCQTDGLNPPRWRYEGQSFIIGDFEDCEQSEVEFTESELLGRRVAIENRALKQLSGQTLDLRRVASSRGLLNDKRYVLVANSISASPDSPDKTKRIASIAAMTILGGFTGMGVIWFASALVVSMMGFPLERLFPLMAPLFVIGWIAGAVVSFRFFKSVFKSSGRTRFAQERTQRKYFGYSGLEGELNWWVFIGIPVPLTAILILLIEPFARTVGEKSGVAVGAIIVIFGAAMYFCDRLPQRLVFRLGIFGWVFTLAFGYWYFKTYGP